MYKYTSKMTSQPAPGMLTRRSGRVNALEQGTLGGRRPPELAGLDPVALVRVQLQSPARDLEAGAQQLGVPPLALHAAAELGIVLAAAAHVADARHDVRGLQR